MSKRRLCLLIAVLAALALLAVFLVILRPGSLFAPAVARADETGVSEAKLTEVVNASNQFAAEFYGELKAHPGNLFFSPYSISSCLAQVYEGAAGQTAAEMQAVLHLPADASVRRPAFAALHNQLEVPSSEFQLSVANALWFQQAYPIEADFAKTLRQFYGSQAVSLDFSAANSQATDTINKWVKRETRGKIGELFGPGSLSKLTRLVLANAVYFKGEWVHKFDRQATIDMPFRTGSGASSPVPMMSGIDKDARFHYTEDDALQAIELPYEGERLAMLVLLPRALELAAAEAALAPGKLQALRAGMQEQPVKVYLPKFKLETSYDLQPPLLALGMHSAFSPEISDFTGMVKSNDLYISDAVHKAYVDVYEEGTEAAGATGVGLTWKSKEAEPIVFLADHPFVFAILDRQTGLILFLGRVENPSL
jgi:serpin B